ncbi:MAG: hypothetical protein R2883_07285 [Caldisericia bacterium]
MRLRKNLSLVLTLLVVLSIVVSCGSSVPELTEEYDGKYMTIKYPESWEIVEDGYSTKLVFEGVMLQFDVIENEDSELGNIFKAEAFMNAKLGGYEKLEEKEVELKVNSSNDPLPSNLFKIKDDNGGRGMIMFSPINGAIYLSQLQPGKYKNVELNTVDAIFNSLSVNLSNWTSQKKPVEWTIQTYDQGYWKFDYRSNWEIEKTDNQVKFLSSDGDELIKIDLEKSEKFNPKTTDTLTEYLNDSHEESLGNQNKMGGLITFDNMADKYYLLTNGQLLSIYISPELGEETVSEIISSFSYIPENDPGIVTSNNNGSDKENNSSNQNQDHSNNVDDKPIDNPIVRKGDTIDNGRFKIILPMGWTYEEVSEMASFINPPEGNGSFIMIEVQSAMNYAKLSLLDIRGIYESDSELTVSETKDVKLGKNEALQYKVEDGEKTMVYTTYMNNDYFYTVKLIVGDKNYSNEYAAFLEWFETK